MTQAQAEEIKSQIENWITLNHPTWNSELYYQILRPTLEQLPKEELVIPKWDDLKTLLLKEFEEALVIMLDEGYDNKQEIYDALFGIGEEIETRCDFIYLTVGEPLFDIIQQVVEKVTTIFMDGGNDYTNLDKLIDALMDMCLNHIEDFRTILFK